MTEGATFHLMMPPDLVEALAQRAAEIAVSGATLRMWFDVHDAAEHLRTSPNAIRAMVRRGQLEPIRRKPRLLFSRDVLDAWVMSG